MTQGLLLKGASFKKCSGTEGKMNIMTRIKRIGELVGEKSIIRIGVDPINREIELLSVDVCTKKPIEPKEIDVEVPEYIG